MPLFEEAIEKLILGQWYHAKCKYLKKLPRVYFQVEILYYRFMEEFNKRGLLFLLILFSCIILSM
jgi:hypothetical protein